MSRFATQHALDDLGRSRLETLSERFRSEALHALASKRRFDFLPLLPSAEDPLRPVALAQFIQMDMELRAAAGQTPLIFEYFDSIPELHANPALAAQILFDDYARRLKHGESPTMSMYEARFPQYARELQRRLFDRTVDSVPVPGSRSPADFETKKHPLDLSGTPRENATRPAVPQKPPSTHDAPTLLRPQPAPFSAVFAQEPGKGSSLLPVGEGYKLIRKLGSGAFGVVWHAEAPGGIDCAVKIISRSIDDASAKQELQALQLMKRLRHPFLVPVHAFWQFEDRLVIAMELADDSLADRFEECRAAHMSGVPAEELLGYFREVAEGLDFLHSQGVQHRDIKPQNILRARGHAKVADFGIAREMDSARSLLNATASGTPLYMPPEVWRGSMSPHSDQYSLAVTYFELRTGEFPFTSRSMVELMTEHLEGSPDLKDLPAAEQKVLKRALAKEPRNRFDSCTAFAKALQEAIAPVVVPGPHRLSRRAWFSIGAACLGSAALGSYALLALPIGRRLMVEVPDVVVRAGESTRFSVAVHRHRFQGTVAIAFEGLPKGIQIQPPQDETANGVIEFEVRSALDVASGASQFTLKAKGGGIEKERTIGLSVEPPKVHLPKDFRPAPNAKIVTLRQTHFFDRIERDVPGVGAIPFVLVPKSQPTDPPTFYMMKNEVSNELFEAFVKDQPDAVKSDEWRRGGVIDGQDMGVKGHEKLPVLNVTAEDADRCARWLGGRLPSLRQWDKAAGRFEPNAQGGPFKAGVKPGEIALDRAKLGPKEVATSPDDVSPFGCLDMTGNAREFTRTFNTVGEVPLSHSEDINKFIGGVILRGRSYNSPELWTFQEAEDSNMQETARYPETSPFTGFRVAVELD